MTQHYFTRNPEMAAALTAQGLRPATMLTHSDFVVTLGGRRIVDYTAIHRAAYDLSQAGDANGLFLVNGEYESEAGPFWCDPDPSRTLDFTKFEATAEAFRQIHEICGQYLGCPFTCTEAWLLPAWHYRGGVPSWRRNAIIVKGSKMNEGATAIYCQIWADDSDIGGRNALAELDRNLRYSDHWGQQRLPRYFQLSPTTKGTPTTGGLLHPHEYTREAARRVLEAGHNIVWFVGNVRVGDVEIPAREVNPTSEAGFSILQSIRAATPVGGGVE